MHRCSVIDVSTHLGRIHVRVVLEVLREAVVLLDDGVEDLGEVLVGVAIAGVDAAVLVVELHGAGNGLETNQSFSMILCSPRLSVYLAQGEARGLGLDASQAVPLLGGDVLGDQAVGRLNMRERRGLKRRVNSILLKICCAWSTRHGYFKVRARQNGQKSTRFFVLMTCLLT